MNGHDAAAKAPAGAFILFPLAIFTSAFLIFFVQPMVAKHILPWFGGSPGVWNLCLAFYQTTLFLGYVYAHLLIRKVPVRWQLAVHAGLLGAAFSVLPVLPGGHWKPAGLDDPDSRILAMLGASVALPFLALASTGPLVQAWFARRFPDRSPYPLYAVSNVGSLLALVAYPFVVEPRLDLSAQSGAWTAGFAATAIAILVCAWSARPGRHDALDESAGSSSHGGDAGSHRVDASPRRVVLWFALPASAVVLLMGVTNELCLDVASVPFLWIVPLVLYLVTFIACFSSEGTYHRGVFTALAGIALILHLGIGEWGLAPDAWATAVKSLPAQAARLLLLLFAGAMVMHGELYRLRPSPESLTAFYLCVSGGGALGGLFVGLLAPQIFADYHELSAGLIACWVFFLAALWQSGSESRPTTRMVAVQGAMLLAVTASLVIQASAAPSSLVLQQRNFFGILRLLEFDRDDPARHRMNLRHGNTMHGMQFQDAKLRTRATAYFGKVTGIGLTFDFALAETPRDVGIIGLGIGTLASYGRPGDAFTFYEIDPDVVQLARDRRYFGFLEESAAEIEVVEGDGRLALEASVPETDEGRLDLLVLDAFSSDAIPVHLLTAEAFRLYASHLRPDGILAAHISNRFLDLTPLVLGLGEAVGMRGVKIHNRPHNPSFSMRSEWVVLSRDAQALRGYETHVARRMREYRLAPGAITLEHAVPAQLKATSLWSDSYSNVFGVLKR